MTLRTAATLLALACGPDPGTVPAPQADVRIVRDALDASTGILGLRATGKPVPEATWDSLFLTEGYQRLKDRELAMRRAFTDSAFREFLLSDTLLARLPELLPAIRIWSEINLGSAAARASAYLPDGTPIRANLYPLIKPRGNSFVHRGPDDVMGIFIYVDPTMPPSELRTTIAHELHHVGYSKACPGVTDSTASPAEQMLLTMLGAFGEGLAMLAAAGGPDVDPNAMSRRSMRVTWGRNMAEVDVHLTRIDTLIQEVAAGRMTHPDTVRSRAATFYGDQGPWYTVGWLMTSTIEKATSRAELLELICDPRAVVLEYQRIAEKGPEKSPKWSGLATKWLSRSAP